MEGVPPKRPDGLASLVDQLEEGMALCKLVYDDGACVDYVVVDANAQYAAHTGLAPADVAGQRGSALFGSVEAAHLRECSAAVAEGTRARFEVFSARLGRHFSVLVVPMGAGSFGTVFSSIRRERARSRLWRRAAWHSGRCWTISRTWRG